MHILGLLFAPGLLWAQGGSHLPVATTLPVEGIDGQYGQVVVYEAEDERYRISRAPRELSLVGVTAERPTVVFTIDDAIVPVVTSGVTPVQVDTSAGSIARGDVLTSSQQPGVAMRAQLADEQVFAVALESYDGSGVAMVLADVSVERARAAQMARRVQAEHDADEQQSTTLIRVIIASIVAFGALGFLLYSLRSIYRQGVISVGRNPRAKSSIVLLSIGGTIAIILVSIIILLVAVGVLVLPIS